MMYFQPFTQYIQLEPANAEPIQYDPQTGILNDWSRVDMEPTPVLDELLTALHSWQDHHVSDDSSYDSDSQTTINSCGPEIVQSSLFRSLQPRPIREPLPTTIHSSSSSGASCTSSLQQQRRPVHSDVSKQSKPSRSQQKQKNQVQLTKIPALGPHDVLLGRIGRSLLQLPGNTKYCKMIDTNMDNYHTAPKFRKMEIAERVIQDIHESGGCFFQFDTKLEQWVEIDNDAILIKKVSHAFRNRLRYSKNSSIKSSTALLGRSKSI